MAKAREDKSPKPVAIFAILTIFAKIGNFAKNRKNRKTLKRKRKQGQDKSRDFFVGHNPEQAGAQTTV